MAKARIWRFLGASFIAGLFALLATPYSAFAAERQEAAHRIEGSRVPHTARLRDGNATNLPFPGAFNLADPNEYNYLVNTLNAAGINGDAYPALFSALQFNNATVYPNAGYPPNTAPGSWPTLDIPKLLEVVFHGGIQPASIISLPPIGGGTSIPASGTTTVPAVGGAPLAFGNVIYGTSASGTTVTSHVGSIQVSGTGGAVTNSVSLPTPSAGTADFAILVYVVVYSASVLPEAIREQLGLQPSAFVAIAGTTLAGIGGQQSIDVTAPVDQTGDGTIKICVVRTGPDCDYNSQQLGGQWILQMPVAATIGFGANIAFNLDGTPNNGSLSGYLYYAGTATDGHLVGQGGACSMDLVPSSIPWNGSGQSVSLTATAANFGPICWPYGATVSLTFNLTANVYTTAVPPVLLTATITNANPAPSGFVATVAPIEAVYGCVADDTMVTMSNGRKLAIPDVKEGMRVRSDHGRILTVDNWMKGPPETLYYLQTRNGHRVGVTALHPVPVAGGVKPAKNVVVGDIVTTERGLSRIVSITQRPYSGEVWNIDVGRKSDDTPLTDVNRTFFGNGILLGDGRMQNRQNLAHADDPAATLARLPPNWHIDYHSAQQARLLRRAAASR